MREFENMSLEELLAWILKKDEKSETVKELATRYGSAKEIYNAPLQEFENIKGIGQSKAKLIKAALELGIRLLSKPVEEGTTITTPRDVFDLLMPRMRYYDREHFLVLSLNTKNLVVNIETISIGSLDSSIVHPREIFKHAIQQSAASIVLAHNHPSGDPFPSVEDMEVTRRLQSVSSIVGINILDHVVIGAQTFFSFKEKELIIK